MNFGTSKRESHYTTPNGSQITQKNQIKDLGIIIEDNWSFHQHITNTAAKGHKMAGWALRTFKSRATKVLKTLLQTLIISHVEYACVVWSPTVSYHIALIESVQRRFTSRFAQFQAYNEDLQMPVCTIEYHERLKKLNIYSLQRRREWYIIIYMYKIIIGMVPNPGFVIDYNPRTKV